MTRNSNYKLCSLRKDATFMIIQPEWPLQDIFPEISNVSDEAFQRVIRFAAFGGGVSLFYVNSGCG